MNGRAMVKVISCHPVTTVIRVQSRSSSRVIYNRQSSTGTGLSLRSSGSRPVSRITPTLILIVVLTSLLLEEQRGKAWEPVNKTMFLRISRKRKVLLGPCLDGSFYVIEIRRVFCGET